MGFAPDSSGSGPRCWMPRREATGVSDRDGELVLGVPRSLLRVPTWWRGVLAGGTAPVLEAVSAAGEFRPRGEVEEDPSWKQVIPYVVLRDGPRIFLMRRTRAGGDARLFERYSIGIGGHVNPADGDVAGGLLREWLEEIDAGFVPGFRFVGLLNDDDDPVGAVHLGLVYAAEAAGRPVAIRETNKLSGRFADPAEVRGVFDRMETWSRLVFEFLDRG
jgi:predicted NUDIX family phosphoesterase